jgi:7-cyano-7-deazaguanine synthase
MNTIVLFSGGLDSTVLLYYLRANGHTCRALSVEYGQRHFREHAHAHAICNLLGVEHRRADLGSVKWLLAGSPLTSYAPDTGELAGASVVVPNRNMLLLALASCWAHQTDADAVAYGAHYSDHEHFPDCRERFIHGMAQAICESRERPLLLLTPFTGYLKADVVRLGASLGVPFALTYSCYAGQPMHCGECGACRERRAAFRLAGVEDTTEYATRLSARPAAAPALPARQEKHDSRFPS